jgi:hypothetical protein
VFSSTMSQLSGALSDRTIPQGQVNHAAKSSTSIPTLAS